jgi:hypothetical protein
MVQLHSLTATPGDECLREGGEGEGAPAGEAASTSLVMEEGGARALDLA